MGLKGNFATASQSTLTCEAVVAYKNTDLLFYVEAFNSNGDVVSAELFSKAIYVISDLKGELMVTRDLTHGVTTINDVFYIKVDGASLDFSGKYKHQFTLFNSSGDSMPPIFQGDLEIKSTF